MKSVLRISLLLVIETVLAEVPEAKRFRCDYTYDKEANGYIKYQEIPASWNDARLRCHLEGTRLVSPLNPELKNLMVRMTNATSKAAVWTGIHATFSRGDYASLEGIPLSQIPHEWMKDEFEKYKDFESCLMQLPDGSLADADCSEAIPYLCFKKFTPDMAMNSCGTTDPEYALNKVTDKCYKFHKHPRTWSKAYMTCVAEGGHLAIINSENESVVLKSILHMNFLPELFQQPHFNNDEVFLGFHYWKQEGNFVTIDGQTLKEAGYSTWKTTYMPTFPTDIGSHTCGAMTRKEGLLTNAGCERQSTFICEKDPKALTCDYKEINI